MSAIELLTRRRKNAEETKDINTDIARDNTKMITQNIQLNDMKILITKYTTLHRCEAFKRVISLSVQVSPKFQNFS